MRRTALLQSFSRAHRELARCRDGAEPSELVDLYLETAVEIEDRILADAHAFLLAVDLAFVTGRVRDLRAALAAFERMTPPERRFAWAVMSGMEADLPSYLLDGRGRVVGEPIHARIRGLLVRLAPRKGQEGTRRGPRPKRWRDGLCLACLRRLPETATSNFCGVDCQRAYLHRKREGQMEAELRRGAHG